MLTIKLGVQVFLAPGQSENTEINVNKSIPAVAIYFSSRLIPDTLYLELHYKPHLLIWHGSLAAITFHAHNCNKQ